MEADDVDWKYSPPVWSAPPGEDKIPSLYLEVLKNGVISEKYASNKYDLLDMLNHAEGRGHLNIGRMPYCDIVLDHDSISRQHAVIQFRENGQAFLYDLGSTHGTKLNKQTLVAKKYVPFLRGGVAKFGASSRLYALGPPPEEDEDESKEEEEVEEEKDESLFEGTYGDARKFIREEQKRVRAEAKKAGKKAKVKRLVDDSKGRERLDIDLAYFDREVFGKSERDDAVKKKRKKDDDDDDSDEGGDSDGDQMRVKGYQYFLGQEETTNENDEFFDRTKASKKKFVRGKVALRNKNVVSAKSLRVDIIRLFDLELQLRRKLEDSQRLEKPKITSNNEEDELDSYMNSVTSNLEQDRTGKIRSEMEAVIKQKDKALAEWKELLTTLQVERETEKLDSEMHKMEVDHGWGKKEPAKKRGEKEEAIESSDSIRQFNVDVKEGEGRRIGRIPRPETAIPRKRKEKVSAPSGSSPPLRSQKEAKVAKDETERESNRARKRRKMLEKEKKKELELFSDATRYEEWVPPSNQSGDGRTSLNAKLGY